MNVNGCLSACALRQSVSFLFCSWKCLFNFCCNYFVIFFHENNFDSNVLCDDLTSKFCCCCFLIGTFETYNNLEIISKIQILEYCSLNLVTIIPLLVKLLFPWEKYVEHGQKCVIFYCTLRMCSSSTASSRCVLNSSNFSKIVPPLSDWQGVFSRGLPGDTPT